jgi:hypothetical protein
MTNHMNPVDFSGRRLPAVNTPIDGTLFGNSRGVQVSIYLPPLNGLLKSTWYFSIFFPILNPPWAPLAMVMFVKVAKQDWPSEIASLEVYCGGPDPLRCTSNVVILGGQSCLATLANITPLPMVGALEENPVRNDTKISSSLYSREYKNVKITLLCYL